MTPSFVPKEERKRKLEKKAAREAMEEKRKFRAAKELAERIAKAYRKDREEKWPWDQHDSTKREIDANKLARKIYLRMKREEYERAAENEKRPRKKQGGLKIGRSSIMEGISEAIGTKFKEKIQPSRKTSEESAAKSAESNKSKESGPKEKNASESRQDRKRRPRTKETGTREQSVEGSRKKRESRASERKATKTATEPSRGDVSNSSGPKVKEKKRRTKGISDTDDRKHHRKSESSDNSKKRELEPRKSVSDDKKVRVYEVKMYKPEIRGVHFRSSEDLRNYIDAELPGMKHLPYFKKIMRDAEGHLKLSDSIGDKKGLTLSEIRGLSEQTGLSFRTTRNYVYKERQPQLYNLTEKAITKSEAHTILKGFHSRLGEMKSHSDVESRLQEKELLEHLRSLKSHEQNDKMVRMYFEFLKNLSEGGTLSDISHRSGVSEATGISWVKGVLPDYVKRTLEELNFSHQRIKPQNDQKEGRHGGRIGMQRPEIKGIPVQSEEHLKKKIAEEYAGFMDMPGFGKLMHEACVHIRLVNELQNREYLEYGEIPLLAKENDIQAGTMRIWTTKGVTPRLYFNIERSISKSKALERFQTINERNNGVVTKEEFNRRLQMYYLREEWQASSFYRRDVAVMQKYSDFMKRYKEGGSLENIACRVGVPTSTAVGWLEGLQPRPIRIASGIPTEQPRPGHLWLPLRFVDGRYPRNCIQVPEKMLNHEDVLAVLKQLEPLESKQMKEWKAKYGLRSIEEEFMYLLGAYISDSGIFNRSTLAQSIGIRLAKKYSWSLDFGEGLCQSLGVCGISSHRNENTPARTTYKKTNEGIITINQSEKLNWASENSPLARWIHRSCLGYKNDIPKREQRTDADWIIKAPFHMRRAILQGLGDGDGSASVQGNYICISSKNNKQFIENLIQTFGVKTRTTRKDVWTTGMAEAKKAAQIPPFRYAEARLEAASRMARRIDARRRVRDNPLKPEEIEFILSMKIEGMTAWDANEAFFDRFRTVIHNEVIKRLYRKSSQRKEEEEKS